MSCFVIECAELDRVLNMWEPDSMHLRAISDLTCAGFIDSKEQALNIIRNRLIKTSFCSQDVYVFDSKKYRDYDEFIDAILKMFTQSYKFSPEKVVASYLV